MPKESSLLLQESELYSDESVLEDGRWRTSYICEDGLLTSYYFTYLKSYLYYFV